MEKRAMKVMMSKLDDEYDVEYPEDDDDLFDDDLDGIGGECALTATGSVYTCGMAGSEECEFECHYNGMIGKPVSRRLRES